MYSQGSAAADVLLSCVNSASSCVFEGIADSGLEMLDWVSSDDDRVQALMGMYRMGICTRAAWKLHEEQQPRAVVQAWLEANSFTGGAGWIANRMKFLEAPARAVLIWSYWHGEPAVASAWRALVQAQQQRPSAEQAAAKRQQQQQQMAAAAERAEFLRFLHGRLHSIESVAMFAEAQQAAAAANPVPRLAGSSDCDGSGVARL